MATNFNDFNLFSEKCFVHHFGMVDGPKYYITHEPQGAPKSTCKFKMLVECILKLRAKLIAIIAEFSHN